MYFKVGEDWLIVYRSGYRISCLHALQKGWPGPEIEFPEDAEARAMTESVAIGRCRPDILADWLDDHYSDSVAVQIAELLRACEQVGVSSIG